MLPKNVHKIDKYGFYLLTKYIIVVYKHGSLTRRKKAHSTGMTHAQMTTWCSFDALAGFTSQLLHAREIERCFEVCWIS